MSSSSSSSDETDVEDRNNGMKTLADLMWQKLKSDKKIYPTASTRYSFEFVRNCSFSTKVTNIATATNVIVCWRQLVMIKITVPNVLMLILLLIL